MCVSGPEGKMVPEEHGEPRAGGLSVFTVSAWPVIRDANGKTLAN